MVYESIQTTVCNPPQPTECTEGECTNISYQYAAVSLPVEIKPTAKMGEIEVECLGDPFMECRENRCKKTCEVTILQNIRVRIPITYKVVACAGDATVECCCDEPC